jgi:4-alpha-glucanotransferase
VRDDPDLLRYARFRGALEHTGRPDALPGADEPAVRRHVLAQVLARRAVADLATHLDRRGVGLLLDLPVGVHPQGYDTWCRPELYVRGVSVGAPPDDFFTDGQNWGFAPPHPETTSAEGHATFAADLAHHMDPAAVLRVDHVMGLRRLFWIPDGFTPHDGVYVRSPADELFAVLSAASHRHRCRIVGENLGTVPPAVERALARHDVLGMWIAQFSWPGDAGDRGRLPSPPRRSIASLSTHDTATFPAWWERLDPATRDRVAVALGLPADADGADATRAAAARVAGGPSELTVVALADLWGETEPQNLPGTGGDTPNWRRRHRRTLAEVHGDPGLAAALRAIGDRRERT